MAIVTLAAPERRDPFVPDMVAELLSICDEIDGDLSLGAAVIQGEGESFCAGAHRALLAEAGRDPAADANFTALGLTYRAFARVGELQVATVAAVRGHAVGAGVNLMMAADLRIVAESARVITGFRRIGAHPGGGHFVLLGRSGSREATAALGLFGLEVDGRRAVELGLAWEALPEAEVEPRALELATLVAEDARLARATVRSFRLAVGPPLATWPIGLEAEKAAQMWSLRRREV